MSTTYRTRSLATVAAAVLAGLALTGCGSSGNSATMKQTTQTAMSPSTPMTSTGDGMASMSGMDMVTIKNFAYSGDSSVKPGEVVMVTNADAEAHTLTSDTSGLFSVTVQPNGMATFHAPMKPGSYAYHCDFHSNMHGTLVVR